MADLTPGGFTPDQSPPPGALATQALNTPPAPQDDAGAGLKRLMSNENKEMAGPQKALDDALNSPRPERPTPTPLPAAPKQDYSKAAQGFISSSLLIAGLASAFSRNHITTGLNAFAAANTGFHKGQIEAGETAYKEWKQASDKVVADNTAMLDEYKAALEDRKASIAEQSQRIAAIASKYKDNFTYQAAIMQNQAMYAQLYEQMRSHTATFDQHAREMAQAHDDRMSALGAKLTPLNTVEGLEKLASLPPDQRKKVLDMKTAFDNHGDPNKMIFANYVADFTEKNGRPPTPEEEAEFRKANLMSQPRSGPAIALSKWMTENPNATAAEVSKAAADIRALAAADTGFGPTGIVGRNIGAINTAINHLDTWEQLALKGATGDVQSFNQLVLAIKTAVAGDDTGTNSSLAGQFVGPEVVKAIVASGGGVEERRDLVKQLSARLSRDQIKGQARTAQEFMAGRLAPIKQQYEQSIGGGDFDQKFLSPRARQIFGGNTAGSEKTDGASPPGGGTPEVTEEQYNALPSGSRYRVPGNPKDMIKP